MGGALSGVTSWEFPLERSARGKRRRRRAEQNRKDRRSGGLFSCSRRQIHLLGDILFSIHGVIDHRVSELQQFQGLRAQPRLLAGEAGIPLSVHEVEIRLGEANLADLLKKRPVPGHRLSRQLQKLGAQGGDAALPPGSRKVSQQGGVVGPDQVVRGLEVVDLRRRPVHGVVLRAEPQESVYRVPAGHEEVGPVVSKEDDYGGLR